MMTIGKLNAQTKETQGGRGPRSLDYSNKSTSRDEQHPEEAFHELSTESNCCHHRSFLRDRILTTKNTKDTNRRRKEQPTHECSSKDVDSFSAVV